MTRRRALLARVESGGVRFPAEYQEVEYIESTGTQYINTGLVPTVGLSFECKFLVTSSDSPGFGNVFGSRYGSNSGEYQLTSYGGGNISVGTRNRVSLAINTVHVVTFDGDTTATVDGTDVNLTIGSLSNTSYNIALFGINQLGVYQQLQAGRIYYCRFGNVRDFVPCYRISDGEIGMFDIVNSTFYTNIGSGTFLKGADVN